MMNSAINGGRIPHSALPSVSRLEACGAEIRVMLILNDTHRADVGVGETAGI